MSVTGMRMRIVSIWFSLWLIELSVTEIVIGQWELSVTEKDVSIWEFPVTELVIGDWELSVTKIVILENSHWILGNS